MIISMLADTPQSPPPGPMVPTTPQLGPAFRSNKKLLLVGASIVLVVAIAIILFLVLPKSNKPAPAKQQGASSELTIGKLPFVHSCSVVTRADFREIFGLNDQNMGAINETTAIQPPGASTTDLAKIAPRDSSSDRFFKTECDLTLAKVGAQDVNQLNVLIYQYLSAADAKQHFTDEKSVDSTTYDDNFQPKDVPLSKLPSMPDTSYVKLPARDLHLLKAAIFHNNLYIELHYSPDAAQGETTENTLPKIDALAQRILKHTDDRAASAKQLDLTGTPSFVGGKFVDICQRADKSALAKSFSNIEFRADKATFINSYGELEGSPAARDGALSNCRLDYRTPDDARNQQAGGSSKNNPLLIDQAYPHDFIFSVRTFSSAADAKTWFEEDKNTLRADVQTMSGIGDGAFKAHSEQTLVGNLQSNGQRLPNLSLDDTYRILKGSRIVEFTFSQTQKAENTYNTAPLKVTDAQVKSAWMHIQDTLDKQK